MEIVLDLFLARDGVSGSLFADKVAELNLAIDPVFTPKPFGSASNLTTDDFVRFAAHCGLTVKKAEGPVRVYCTEWRRARDAKLSSKSSKMDIDME
jgi:hypothetical protein